MMILRILFIISLLLTAASLQAQVTIIEEPEITQIMETYKRTNMQTSVVRAWRIQILTTNDRRKMENGIKKFEQLYPAIEYKWEHNPPYYQVRIGAYELREDLEAMLLQLKRDFPSALPVQDEMKKTELLKS